MFFFVSRIAPYQRRPWLPPISKARRAWYEVVWMLSAPWMLFAHLGDRLLAPVQRRPGLSNAYRVLARKVSG